MIKVIIAATFMGGMIIWIVWNLGCMFCIWAFPSKKPKGKKTYENLSTGWSKTMSEYKKMEYYDQLNDN